MTFGVCEIQKLTPKILGFGFGIKIYIKKNVELVW